MFIKYDAYNRPVYTGQYVNTTSTSRAQVQSLADAAVTTYEVKQGSNIINSDTVYYSNNAFPNANITLFTISYYDDYNFNLDGGVAETSYGKTSIVNAKGLVTGKKIKVLGSVNWISDVIYYDTKGRPIYSYSKNNYFGTTDKVKSNLDFIGKTLQTITTHLRGTTTTTIEDIFTYNRRGQLLTQKQKINAQLEEFIVANTYDDLGQLISKDVGGKITQNRLQNVNFKYNIRGWLKSINNTANVNNTIALGPNDLFGFQINYDDPSSGTALYNGNISQTFWKTANDPLANTSKNYNYTYDALDRLIDATDNLGKFKETITYDKNGNIKTLKRLGEIVGGVPDITIPTNFGVMDDLTYTYDAGNKLQIVSDNANDIYGFKDDVVSSNPDTTVDYTYDANGNMLTDSNKGMNTNILYNYLNLPTKIVLPTGNISYTYNANGEKVQKVVYYSPTLTTTTTDYINDFQYEKINTGAVNLKFFPSAEGYIVNNAGVFSYIYQYKDHLGSVRLSYGDSNSDGVIGSGEVIEENNYYPFGLKHKGYNSGVFIGNGNPTAQKYKYNGKELQDELGLNFYDYGARNYDPALGRWMNIDPKAEKYSNISPYVYVADNPIIYIDPDGKEIIVANKADQGAVLKMINSKALGTFAFNKSGHLYLAKAGGDSSKFSSYYSKQLVAAIKDKDKINISIGQTFQEKGQTKSVDNDAGGGVTSKKTKTTTNPDGTKTVTKEADVTISGNPLVGLKDTNGNALTDNPADILAHELVGHAIPHITKTDTGNAVDNENKVRKDTSSPERANEPNHKE
jgi:RHS repeat-associated protein